MATKKYVIKVNHKFCCCRPAKFNWKSFYCQRNKRTCYGGSLSSYLPQWPALTLRYLRCPLPCLPSPAFHCPSTTHTACSRHVKARVCTCVCVCATCCRCQRRRWQFCGAYKLRCNQQQQQQQGATTRTTSTADYNVQLPQVELYPKTFWLFYCSCNTLSTAVSRLPQLPQLPLHVEPPVVPQKLGKMSKITFNLNFQTRCN